MNSVQVRYFSQHDEESATLSVIHLQGPHDYRALKRSKIDIERLFTENYKIDLLQQILSLLQDMKTRAMSLALVLKRL